MNKIFNFAAVLLFPAILFATDVPKNERDYSGTYCLSSLYARMTISQEGSSVSFTISADTSITGTGTVFGDTLTLTSMFSDSSTFNILLDFSPNRKTFLGTYQLFDNTGMVIDEGQMQGVRGVCPTYDIAHDGIPKFVKKDFTQLAKIEKISKFRSGEGHDFSDGFETCRSMKHYYSVYEGYRLNNVVEIRSPVAGDIVSISNDGHGASIGLNNKQIQIRPDGQPAFVIRIFHCDLASSAICAGKRLKVGELLGHARLYYEDLGEHAGSFDIAVFVNTPDGRRLISYFNTLSDAAFSAYTARGVTSRQDFIITQEERDADPLQCNGEEFMNSGNLGNWVMLDEVAAMRRRSSSTCSIADSFRTRRQAGD
jgi:hypothetical protein